MGLVVEEVGGRVQDVGACNAGGYGCGGGGGGGGGDDGDGVHGVDGDGW